MAKRAPKPELPLYSGPSLSRKEIRDLARAARQDIERFNDIGWDKATWRSFTEETIAVAIISAETVLVRKHRKAR